MLWMRGRLWGCRMLQVVTLGDFAEHGAEPRDLPVKLAAGRPKAAATDPSAPKDGHPENPGEDVGPGPHLTVPAAQQRTWNFQSTAPSLRPTVS